MLTAIAVTAVIVVALLAAVFVYAQSRPDTFRVERSASIKAPPEKIFPLINDLRGFARWSPFENKDPDMKRVYSGPASGRGAAYDWDGNKNIGKGRLEIADSSPHSSVTMKLDFVRPFECHNIVEFTLDRKGGTTDVTWAMHGPNHFIGKVMSLFCDMDKMCGKDFEAGLAKLKELTEGNTTAMAPAA